MQLKSAVKWSAGRAAVVSSALGGGTGLGACIFMYHRVTRIGFVHRDLDSWNVPPAVLAGQIAALSQAAEIVPLSELPERLQNSRSRRPLVSLTFDDGFVNFGSAVLPILEQHGVPATLFVPTQYVGTSDPMPFDSWGQTNQHRVDPDAWRAMSWGNVEECLDSGLVEIGSHSHRHLNGRNCSAEELKEEAEMSRDVLQQRLGNRWTKTYAYPYGSSRLGQVNYDYEQAVREAGYARCVSTDLGLATRESNPLRLPRVEVHATDSPSVLRAKSQGALVPYQLTDRLRRARRGADHQ